MHTIKNIVVLMAMTDEAQPIIDTLAMVKVLDLLHPELPINCYQKSQHGINISLLVSGMDARYQVDHIGSEAATLMAYEAITKLQPDLIISAGTAGGFKKRGASIGTVYMSQQHFIYHDRHVPLPGFDQSSIGKYPAAKINRLAKDLNLQTGVISTGSSLEKNKKDDLLIDAHDAVAKEMEAAAIAWVAMLFDIPVMAIKSITNLVDEDNQSEQEFVDNLQYSVQCLHHKVIQLLDYLPGKTIADLEYKD